MAYEELPPPAFILPFPLELDRDGMVDFVLTATSINFAFTDFETACAGRSRHGGRALADADGMHFCLQRALAEGVPVLDGAWLAEVTEEQLREIFRGGNSELQLLDERARLWREVGATLVERYDGRFSNVFARPAPAPSSSSCSRATSRASTTPPSTTAQTVRFWKLAQLSVWILQATLPAAPASPTWTA